MAVEEPLKLQVLKALTAHLEGIKGPDWGDFDLTGCVFRGRNRFGDDVPETFISILEAPRTDPGREAGTNSEARNYDWPLLLQAWTKEDAVHPSDPIYMLEQEITLRLTMIIAVKGGNGFPRWPETYMLGGLVSSFGFGPGTVRPPTDGLSSKSFLYMPLRVGLATVV